MVTKFKHPTQRQQARIDYDATGARKFASGMGYALDLILVKAIKNTGRNYFCAALKQLGSPLKELGNFLTYKHYETSDKFNPQIRNELLSDFRLSYTSEMVQPVIEIVDKYETCFNQRAKNIDDFRDVHTTGKERFIDLLGTSQDAKVIKDAINAALNKVTHINDVRANLKAAKALAESDNQDSPIAISSMLESWHNEAKNKLNQQFAAEQKELTELFNDSNFNDKVKSVLGTAANEAQVEHLKQELLASLKVTHEKAVAPIQDPKQVDELITKLREDANRAEDELHLISLMYVEGSNTIHDKIASLIKKSKNALSIQKMNADAGENELQGVTINRLGEFETLSGLRIISTGNGVMLDFPPYWHSYHHSADEYIIADLQFLALAIKAKGHKEIVFTIDDGHQPQKESQEPTREDTLEMARKAYKAARLMGFSQNKITLKINGESITPTQLFHGSLASVEEEAEEMETQRKNYSDKQGKLSTKEYKNRVAKQVSEDPKSATPNPSGMSP